MADSRLFWQNFRFANADTPWKKNFNALAEQNPDAAFGYLTSNGTSDVHNAFRRELDQWAGTPISGSIWNAYSAGGTEPGSASNQALGLGNRNVSSQSGSINGTGFNYGGSSFTLPQDDLSSAAWQGWATPGGYNTATMNPAQLAYFKHIAETGMSNAGSGDETASPDLVAQAKQLMTQWNAANPASTVTNSGAIQTQGQAPTMMGIADYNHYTQNPTDLAANNGLQSSYDATTQFRSGLNGGQGFQQNNNVIGDAWSGGAVTNPNNGTTFNQTTGTFGGGPSPSNKSPWDVWNSSGNNNNNNGWNDQQRQTRMGNYRRSLGGYTPYNAGAGNNPGGPTPDPQGINANPFYWAGNQQTQQNQTPNTTGYGGNQNWSGFNDPNGYANFGGLASNGGGTPRIAVDNPGGFFQ